jgi:hypothetical protein
MSQQVLEIMRLYDYVCYFILQPVSGLNEPNVHLSQGRACAAAPANSMYAHASDTACSRVESSAEDVTCHCCALVEV